jgi:DNA-binding Lrp family transcriptional regulator
MFKIQGLDSINNEILNALQINAEMPIKQIAYKIHKSESATHERIKLLKKGGFVKASVLLLDYTKLHKIQIAYILVKLNDHSALAASNFCQKIDTFDEVMECSQITGYHDFHLKVATTCSGAFYTFFETKLKAMAIVGETLTNCVLAEHKRETALKLS